MSSNKSWVCRLSVAKSSRATALQIPSAQFAATKRRQFLLSHFGSVDSSGGNLGVVAIPQTQRACAATQTLLADDKPKRPAEAAVGSADIGDGSAPK